MWQFARTSPAQDELSPGRRYQKLKADIHRQMVEAIDLSQIERWKPERLRQEVQALAVRMAGDLAIPLGETERNRLTEELLDEAFGLGPLEALMNDPTVSDILVNGAATVYVER